GIAGAGVEQHADGGEVDGGAGALDAVGGERGFEGRPAIDVAGGEVAPAAVIGDALQVGIGGARHLRHVGGDGGKLFGVEGEVGRAAVGDVAMHEAAALAHGGGGVEAGERGGGGGGVLQH